MTPASCTWDVLVIGGGHAGIEAAHAAARIGLATALLTPSLDAIGRMSCNPAIGGLAKGQLVREIDALGGLMGLLADRAGIQFKMLNRSRGPAVWGPRAQCDRALYARLARRALSEIPGLSLLEGLAEELVESGGRVAGVVTASGERIGASAVIVTTGTFLRALMHTGERRTEGGRVGEPSARGLSRSLASLGLRLGRFKTGTPPRVHRDTVDFSLCRPQQGDDPPVAFSFRTPPGSLRGQTGQREQALCWLTATNEDVHRIIRANLDRSPMYSGAIRATGPRYCPSVEDKVVRFAEKTSHLLFLEPDGDDSPEIYVNGLSTSLPEEVQAEILARIPSLARARMIRPGYAVEYDYVMPDQLAPTLGVSGIGGLFLAGQINGTSGYEEAAAQGIWAGINAALFVRGDEPFLLQRSEAYAAVLVDDLTSKGLDEPYRLFTSRAEHRLVLGVDTVLRRLVPHGLRLGLLSQEEHDAGMAAEERVARAEREVASTAVLPDRATREAIFRDMGIVVDTPTTVHKLLKRLDLSVETAAEAWPEPFRGLSREERQIVQSRARYEGYIRRENQRLERLAPLERRTIPEGISYRSMPGLSHEMVERCERRRPRTLGEAARLPGLTPAALAIISAHVARGGRSAG